MSKGFRANSRMVSAGACVVIAAFFAFALEGYRFAALFFLLLGAALFLYALAEKLKAARPAAAKRLRVGLNICVCVAVGALIVIEAPIVRASTGDKEPEADYLIVLGAGVNGTEPSVSLKNRLDAALEYLREYPEARCIVTGGKGAGEDITEAECMYRWLTENGVEPGRVIKEDKASNTAENIKFSLALAEKGASVAIVTSEYHLYRAKYMAAELGVHALGVPARTTLPVLMLSYFFREAFAVVKMWVFGWT